MSSSNRAPEPKPSRLWASVIIFLLVVTVIAIVIALIRYKPAKEVEISLPATTAISGNVQIGGAVASPGIYPFTTDDTLGKLIQAAGGTTANGDSSALMLTVLAKDTQAATQKININRAEAWLLEALPGIGATKAATIVAYREANGPFKTTADLMKVDGIGQSLYNQIQDLITVTD